MQPLSSPNFLIETNAPARVSYISAGRPLGGRMRLPSRTYASRDALASETKGSSSSFLERRSSVRCASSWSRNARLSSAPSSPTGEKHATQ